MLTFEMLRDFVNKEKSSETLIRIPEDFFEQARSYLEKKSKAQEKGAQSWEFESTRRLLEDLLEVRERKIVTMALFHIRSGMMPTHITLEEKNFFDSLVKEIKGFQQKKKDLIEGEKEPLTLIGILDELPAFVGTDLKTYGPFKKGDVGTVPQKVAALLIEKGHARALDKGL